MGGGDRPSTFHPTSFDSLNTIRTNIAFRICRATIKANSGNQACGCHCYAYWIFTIRSPLSISSRRSSPPKGNGVCNYTSRNSCRLTPRAIRASALIRGSRCVLKTSIPTFVYLLLTLHTSNSHPQLHQESYLHNSAQGIKSLNFFYYTSIDHCLCLCRPDVHNRTH